MEAGALRHRVTLEQPVRTVNGAGETTITWEEVATVWGDVEVLKAWQIERAAQVGMRRSHLVRIRYPDDLDTAIRGDWRVNWEGVILNITGIVNPAGRNVELELSCEEEIASPPPPALTLVSAHFMVEDEPHVRLTFDRAIDLATLDSAQVTVDDPLGSGFAYAGIGVYDIPDPESVELALAETGGPTGAETLLNATAATGIVAVDDGAAWAGVSNVELPFP